MLSEGNARELNKQDKIGEETKMNIQVRIPIREAQLFRPLARHRADSRGRQVLRAMLRYRRIHAYKLQVLQEYSRFQLLNSPQEGCFRLVDVGDRRIYKPD